ITTINNSMFQMQQQVVSGHKMMDFMACEPKITGGNEKVKPVSVDLKFSHASMVLDGVQVLHDISIDIPQGKKVGVVGGTGSGKSLLLESLIRVHDMTSGEITLNGKDIREYELDSLRDNFAYVFQDVFLFSNTIDSNIAYSDPDIEQEQVISAAKHAQAHGFIERLQDGYNTIVGERGIGISGGQKQRVSIARALLKDAPVLVLDDSTSALDVDTERQLLYDIKKCYPDKTLLITAHRLSSVVDCDEILYMQDGRVVERGTFEELMQLNGHFASVYNIQQVQQSAVVDFDGLAEDKLRENESRNKPELKSGALAGGEA
ncbi:MAG: ABC transporter ATP-binding protein/permease, partial [Clostridiales bacterium]|nr:ABC transporter ATP-binding protein/permease [Clostridiales bacterium]